MTCTKKTRPDLGILLFSACSELSTTTTLCYHSHARFDQKCPSMESCPSIYLSSNTLLIRLARWEPSGSKGFVDHRRIARSIDQYAETSYGIDICIVNFWATTDHPTPCVIVACMVIVHLAMPCRLNLLQSQPRAMTGTTPASLLMNIPIRGICNGAPLLAPFGTA